MKPIHITFALIVALCWGLNFAASKFSVEHFPPFTVTFLRYALVSALLFPLLFKAPQRGWRDTFILSALMVTLHFSLVFTAIWMGLSITTTVIAVQLGAPFSVMLSVFLFKDHLGPWRTGGMVLAFLGVIIVSGEPDVAEKSGAFMLAVAGAMAWAGSNIYMKRFGDVKILPLLAWTGLLSLPQMGVLMLLFEGDLVELVSTAPMTAWGGVIYSVIFSTIVGYGLWYFLLRQYEVSQVAPFSLLVPIAGIAGGVLLFDEVLTVEMVIGSIITIIGVGIITLRRPKLARVEKL